MDNFDSRAHSSQMRQLLGNSDSIEMSASDVSRLIVW
mgnify:FL=1